MSSWKKASKTNQKVHRERHQPEVRKHLGLLEKKKDYKLRAKDVHEKEKALKLLHKRALNKNPDEFYHHMIRSKVIDDEHREKDKSDEHTKEQLSLMQTQDVKYVAMKRTIESNKIRRLQSELHMIEVANKVPNKHILFVDDEKDVKNFNLCERFETHPQLIGRKVNRLRISDLEKLEMPEIPTEELQRLAAQRNNAYKELAKRITREKELSVVLQKMELKRTLQQKRAIKPKRIKPGTKESAPVYKIAYERKR